MQLPLTFFGSYDVRCSEKVFVANENLLLYYFIVTENLWTSKWTKDQIKSMVLEQFKFF